MRRSRLAVAPLAALAFAVVLFARGHPYDLDQLGLAIPYARIFDDALRARSFPTWTDAIWCGYPVHAEGQGGFLALPYRACAALPLDEVLRIEVEIALALVLAALSAAWAARELGRSSAGAAVAGAVWSLGGGLLAYQENPAVLEACSFLPLALGLAARHARTGDPRAFALSGGALGLVLLAGWPYAFLLGAPVVLAGFVLPPVASTLNFRKRLGGASAAILLALLVGAAQWLPTAELVRRSERGSGLDPGEVLGQAPLHLGDLVRLVSPAIPLAERTTERSVVFAYLGVPALALVALGLRRARHSRSARFFLVLLGGALAMALLPEVSPGIARALASVPPFSLVRGPSKMLVLVGLAAAFLAAEGVDVIARRRPRLAWLAVALVLVDLFVYGQRKALLVEREVLRTVPAIVGDLPLGERVHAFEARSVPYAALPPTDRAAFFRRAATVEPDANVLWDVPIVGGYGPLAVERSRRLALAPTLRHLARASATRIVAPPDRSIPAPELAARPAGRIYAVPDALPRARVATTAIVASDARGAFALAAVAPLEQAVLEGEDGARAAASLAPRARGAAELLPSPAPTLVRVRAHVEIGPALVVLADTWDPGWRATIDGTPATLLRSDYAFRGVVVPPGTHEVVFRHEPWTFPAGLALSGLGAFLVGALQLRPGRRASAADRR